MVGALALLAAGAAGATVLTYTESNDLGDNVALGYPVPGVVDSAAPVDGFRRYASLLARHRDLAAAEHVREVAVGTTLEGRTIPAFVIGDADSRTADDAASEGAALVNGGIHAREWQSPEVVSALLERLARRETAVTQFITDNLTTVIVPVANIDGFIHTQRTPTQALATTFASDPPSWPRDGRMRRKNKRDVDDDLFTEADGLLGVDLNRNNAPFWATSSRSSGQAGSLVHHGVGPASEPETVALLAAADLGPAQRLRLYFDVHSFTRVFFAADTGNTRRDANASTLIDVVRAATSGYGYDPSPAGVGIGATDEYFAYTYQIPSYTLEIEPGPNGGADYDGTGGTHSGFILPASQIARVRDELADALLLGMYRQAGPPVVLAATAEADGQTVFQGRWVGRQPSGRELVAEAADALPVGEITLAVQFDRPMRVREGDAIVQYRGQSVALLPDVRLVGDDAAGLGFEQSVPTADMRWATVSESNRYDTDTLSLTLSVDAGSVLASARRVDLVIDAQDLSGQRLDVNPATATDWVDGGWGGYEDADGRETDAGGPSPAFRLVGAGQPLDGLSPPSSGGGGGSGVWPLSALVPLWCVGLIAAVRRRRYRGGCAGC